MAGVAFQSVFKPGAANRSGKLVPLPQVIVDEAFCVVGRLFGNDRDVTNEHDVSVEHLEFGDHLSEPSGYMTCSLR